MSPPRPTVAVVVTVHNGAAHLREQLASIAAQDDHADEVVIADDASSDDSLPIASAFASDNGPHWRVLPTPTNLGLLANLERALRSCTADVILLADQDDRWRADKVRRFRALFAASPGTVAAFSDARVCDASLRGFGFTLWQVEGFPASERRLFATGEAVRLLADRNIVQGASLGFRRSLLPALLPFPGDLHFRLWCHDGWIAAIASAHGPVGLLEEPLLDYRVHGANQIARYNRAHVVRRWLPRWLRTWLRSFLQARSAGTGTSAVLAADLAHQCRHLAHITSRLEALAALGAPTAAAAELSRRLHAARRLRAQLPRGIIARLRATSAAAERGAYRHETTPLRLRLRDILGF